MSYGSTPPPPPASQGGYGTPAGSAPPNNLVWGIVSIFLCWPLAIPSIIFATQVNSKWATGDAAGAMDASAKAKKFGLIGIVIGAVVLVLYVILIVIGAAASSRR